jgi:hypothetical protein
MSGRGIFSLRRIESAAAVREGARRSLQRSVVAGLLIHAETAASPSAPRNDKSPSRVIASHVKQSRENF